MWINITVGKNEKKTIGKDKIGDPSICKYQNHRDDDNKVEGFIEAILASIVICHNEPK